MVENLDLVEQPGRIFEAVAQPHWDLGEARFSSITDKIGVDIFDEQAEQPLQESTCIEHFELQCEDRKHSQGQYLIQSVL